ncbi:MAG: MarR family winged helix-turn-helix transcriptional regulator [Sphingopyxis sp.]|jgi:DNA-binding MarR family transcriptional regulator|uniref:MarR family winged helix-turn-helix transcriptional regulator n=1 Tax=unclassified Sphingopyxis TaxID=2614943 RepID=UPI0007301B5C|nr:MULTISPECIES: MarR family winged helix-turn-helix transcriptional regulator [unclassified Sphingopyxis]KTD99927.1 MarR family transcriptional regulator [Sphingopyxis sp. H012]KTE07112.1 MarR family transcriptional regulator [Sphingopyxis sp. H053]KTE09062.1 MarR family transcriptional regulator [Sphingopyxis sp. H093]KTE18455.1 MarR family transcriptional regulator [Sphingopyxis sp. H080]KTE36362.1 MarR family transcriptional regulator [Sphingopyxis sp. H038]
MRTNQLIIALFQRFCWLDEGLQARLHDHGWPDVNRPQSMVMTNIVSGIVRPSDIARNLGISRQAIHSTINQMVKLGIVQMDVDPADRRHMVVSLTDLGARMRKDAQRSMDDLTAQIAAKLGQDKFDALLAALEADWGDNIDRPVAAPRR